MRKWRVDWQIFTGRISIMKTPMKMAARQISLCLVGLLAAAAGSASGADKILPYAIHQHQLDNGLNVVTVPFDAPGLAAFYIITRVGSRNEVEEGVTGFAHFFEHMMFRGTEKYSKEQYAAALKSTGAAANANTSLDRTVYHMTGNAAELELMFELESDRFMNLAYSEHDFKTEAGAVKGEYTKNFASPYSQLREKQMETAYTTHTYGHTTMGYFDDIVDMPNQYEYSMKFFDRYYRPEYNTVLVVGDVTPERVNALAKQYFGDWKRGDYVSEVPAEPEQTETRYTHLQNGSIPPYFSMSYKSPAFSDAQIDMPALDVLASLVFSDTSELYKKLVLQEQKVRFMGGGAYDTRDPGLFSIQASLVDKADMGYVMEEIEKAIAKVQSEGVDEEQLKRTKSNLKYGFAMRMDTPTAIAESLSHYIQLTGDPESVNRLYALYDKVTVDDVKNVASTYLQTGRLTIATISDDEQGALQ
jgi:zinc protease